MIKLVQREGEEIKSDPVATFTTYKDFLPYKVQVSKGYELNLDIVFYYNEDEEGNKEINSIEMEFSSNTGLLDDYQWYPDEEAKSVKQFITKAVELSVYDSNPVFQQGLIVDLTKVIGDYLEDNEIEGAF